MGLGGRRALRGPPTRCLPPPAHWRVQRDWGLWQSLPPPCGPSGASAGASADPACACGAPIALRSTVACQ
eukprot:5661073-Alexandrium_andersonii.AAC.1